jgi:hypothetical protein
VSRVANRDRAVRRLGVLYRTVDPLQDLAIGKLGQQRIDRIVQAQLALLDQDHRGGSRDWLGHRGDPEDGVAADGGPADGHVAGDVDVNRVLPAHESDQAGYLATLDVAIENVAHAQQPLGGQSPGGGGHCLGRDV